MIYISFSHNPVRKVELKNKKGGRAMLYLRCEDEPPYGEAPDDTNGLRHPWWRRWLDKGRRLFRR